MDDNMQYLKRLLPEPIQNFYHAVNACMAALWYGLPGTKLTMTGITGTKGKTSAANLTWSVLDAGGFKTGLIGTINIRTGKEAVVNTSHMSMPGPWVTQKLLRNMLNHGCSHVVMEVTSEGLKQYRHWGIKFRFAVFTNLSPEHLASHGGSFEKYKQMKSKLFKSLHGRTDTVSIVNMDDEQSEYYRSFPTGKVITYGLHSGALRAVDIRETEDGVRFTAGYETYNMKLLGTFNVYNALPAIAIGNELGISPEKIRAGISALSVIPGRMEKIEEGQDFIVIVDYAHEKLSMNTLLDTARGWATESQNIIAIVGAEGGGRDPAKREHIGRAAGTKADYVIVTTTDPYDDDPSMLAESIAGYAELSGKERDRTLFVILDRRQALQKAFSLARSGDIVLATGMGAQETMIAKDGPQPWNEREIIRELLREKLEK
jgi:UDP-N-acetylmuramoyl-L-alanyl-D-glutamate--2,6-diaminopimelate ligase